MLRFLALAGLLLATPSPQNDSTRRVFSPDTQADTRPDAPLSERRVSYDIDVTLDPEAKTVSGVERITWRNTGPQPVGELQFHMYLNAFKPGSTFMRESGGRHRGFEASSEDRWGGVELSSLRIVDAPLVPDGDLLGTPALDPITAGTELLDEARFIQPDDSNLSDETVLSVPLPEAVAPGETVTIEIDFVSTLPEIVARTGWATSSSGEPFFMVAQWFPKLGVYEIPGQRYVPADAETGRWSTHQFHANSEFYADFGTYRVRMTVPADYELGATGQQVSAEDLGEQRAETYWAADVHDFAWTTGANLLVFEDQWEDVQLRLLMQPEHEAQAQRHFDAAKIALDRFDAWYGEYPYPTLTLVDGVGGSNGMEYPTLITCGTVYMLPEWARPLELVTIHEFGHQYWYGLVASNEAEEAWLDEGINSYSEVKVMEEAYGRGSVIDFPGFKISDSDFQRLSYTEQNPTRGAIYARSWDYTTRG
ncbi:MAG: M1 family metallopeptidase, partial [Bacteroidota bacterium]